MKITHAILILLVLVSCSEGPEEPSNLIERDKFVDVLTEFQILEAAYTQRFINLSNPDSAMLPLYRGIFNRFEVDLASFEASLHYYRQDEETIKEIYDEVISNISEMEDKIKKDHGLTIE